MSLSLDDHTPSARTEVQRAENQIGDESEVAMGTWMNKCDIGCMLTNRFRRKRV